MSIYEKLDAALLANIEAGMKKLIWISGGHVRNEAIDLAMLTGIKYFLIVDQRLQALRKAKKIIYASKIGWTVAREVKS